MMRRCLVTVLLTGFWQPALAGGAVCPPADIAPEAAPLPHLAAALRPGATLPVLAVGSFTVFAPTASPRADMAHKPAPGTPPPAASPSSFVAQAAHALEAGVHGLRVVLTVRGGSGLTASEMAATIRSELARTHYRLVLWQTGTVDAVDQVAPGDFYQALAEGAAATAAAGADLVLIDPQYSRFLEANANLQPYLSTLQDVGALPDVTLFHRYALMRDWADGGAIDLERTPKSERAAAAARLHLCLGRELARTLLAEAANGKP